MKYSVKFFPEKRKGQTENLPVRLRVTYSQTKMEYYTGKRCNVLQWDIKTSRLKKNQIVSDGSTSTSFNAELNKINVAVDDLFKLYDVTNNIPSANQLRTDLKSKLGKETKKEQEQEKIGFFERFEQYKRDAPLSPGRAKHVGTTLNKVQSFRSSTTFDSIDSQFLTDFKNYLTSECNLANNTVVSELRRLRAFFGWAVKKGWTANYPFSSFVIGSESYGDPVYITVAERDKLYCAFVKDKTLAIVRDIFVFQCLVGCRVGDLRKLTKTNIINGNLEYIAGKTKDDKPRVARVPLTDKAKSILARYNLPSGKILPFLPEHDYNEHLKLLFKLDNIKITRMVTVPDPKTRMSLQKSIADIVSSHMARRVFIGSLHKKGVKNEIIASMSGHVKDSKAFSRYYTIDEEDQKEAMKAIE